jgi:hypothetical protein
MPSFSMPPEDRIRLLHMIEAADEAMRQPVSNCRR